MAHKLTFTLRSNDPNRPLPAKVVIGRQPTETMTHVLLKLFSYVLFFRERLQIETKLDSDHIPFVPDLAQLDYEMRVQLWVECGECSVQKLDKLAVKVPEAEIWIVKRSLAAAEDLARAMRKADLRRNRYSLIGLDEEIFEEISQIATGRNEFFWVSGGFTPPEMQFDFNGLWFEMPFSVLRF